MSTYSFLDIVGTIVGPGGAFPIGASAGVTEEGITVSPKEEKNTMTFGADGEVMQSLHAGKPGRAVVRLLKTSPINGALSLMYNTQQTSSANWGQNTIVFSDTQRGDVVSLTQAAFAKQPDVTYDKAGHYNEWVFDGVLTEVLGFGAPSATS